MTKDNFIVHSGNQKAYKSLMYSIKNTAQNQSPICLIGQPGSGKTSLLSHILIQGESRGFCPGYINIQRLKYRDISANKGAKGLSFEYFTKSNLTAIDNVEEVPTSNKSTWIRNLIYGFAEQGLTANSLQLFSFTGDRTQYVNFLNNIPLVSLKDKWKLAEVIELDYPEDSEHKLFIKKSIENSGVVPTKPEELEKIVSHIDSAIPKNYPISVRGIQEYLTQAINPAKRMGVMTPGGVTASLSYQTTIYNPDTKNPVAIFDKIMQETGYDTDIITKKGRREEVISMKKNVIKLLWEGGIKSSSEIARLMKVTPSTISNHFKKMDIK